MEKRTPLSYLIIFLLSFVFSLSSLILPAQSLNWIDQDAASHASQLKAQFSTFSTSSTSSTSSTFFSTSPNIDIKFHRILLTLDPAVRYVSGSVSTYFTPITSNLREITFDLSDSLQVTAVRYHGELVSTFSHGNDKLTITLPGNDGRPTTDDGRNDGRPTTDDGRPTTDDGRNDGRPTTDDGRLKKPFFRQSSVISHQSVFIRPLPSVVSDPSSVPLDSIMVDYMGVPPDGGLGSFTVSTHDSIPVLYTLSEPYGAKDWWPCKQDLNDKIDSVMLVISVPKAYKAAANGMLISSDCGCADKNVFIWMHKHPIAAYLVGVAVTNYAVYSDYVSLANIGRSDSIEILNYVYPETLTETRTQTRLITKPFQLFNQLFGLYPFADERYGHAEWNWGGGMEHQTMSFMGSFGYDLMAHELGHQWFGDYLTCGSWRDIWLNEGFATYMVGLCYERDQDGIYWEPFKRLSIKRVVREPGGSVYCYDTTNADRIFDARLSYSKGAMVLHMLRWEMGDEPFFSALNNYLHDPLHANGYATTEDLIRHCEAVSGTSFREFFNDWVYGEGYPKYNLIYRPGEGTSLQIELSQESSDPSVSFFEMDVPVRLWGHPSPYLDVKLHHTANHQVFTVDPGFMVDSVQFDPERWICTENAVVLNVEGIVLNDQVKIYPNPVADRLMINCAVPTSDIRVSLYDTRGRKVSEKVFPSTSGLIEFPVEGVPEGVYVVEVHTSTSALSRKLVIRR